MGNANSILEINDFIAISTLDYLFAHLKKENKNHANRLRSDSHKANRNLHEMIIKESKFMYGNSNFQHEIQHKIFIINKLCQFCKDIEDIENSLKKTLILTINNLNINFEGKLIIGFQKLHEMDDSDRIRLFKILVNYKKYDIKESNFKDGCNCDCDCDDCYCNDNKSYRILTSGKGKYRIRFESDRDEAIENLNEHIQKFIICSTKEKKIVISLLQNLHDYEKDRIVDLMYTVKNYSNLEVVDRSFMFACGLQEITKCQIIDFIDYIEFALATYMIVYAKHRYEIQLINKAKPRSPESLRIILGDIEKADSWKSALILTKPKETWNKLHKKFKKLNVHNKPFIEEHQCIKPCELNIGFRTISSCLYHFIKHSHAINANQLISTAMNFINHKKTEVSFRFSQTGTIRIFKMTSEYEKNSSEEKRAIKGLAYVTVCDGYANIASYMPNY